MDDGLALFPLQTARDAAGRLAIRGHDLPALADRYGTPLYLYDQPTLDDAVARIHAALAAHWPGEAVVAYAGKAWLSSAMAAWVAARALGLDVVSLGELRIALRGGVPAARIHAHGNLKDDHFLTACVQAGVGRVVVDGADEATRLARICRSLGRSQPIWLRMNPAVAAETHHHLVTAAAGSKFGVALDEESLALATTLGRSTATPLVGLHFHVGSQLAEAAPQVRATTRLLTWAAALPGAVRARLVEFCPGGGWAVATRPGDPTLTPAHALRHLAPAILDGTAAAGLPRPRLFLEPGREIAARAGVALYRVGAVKETSGGHFLFLDGGMGDNPRPALYDARYTAVRADAGVGAAGERRYYVAGPYCESGDVWPEPVQLAQMAPGALVAVPVSGAYHLSMASSYNGVPRPAVLWLARDRVYLVQERESIEALWARDRALPASALTE